MLFKEHKKSLGFIENIPECSCACFTFMGKVFFVFVLFSADTHLFVGALNLFFFSFHVVKYVVYE